MRVQRRVGDLGEALGEVLRQAALLVGQRVDGVAVAHRGDALGAVGQHRVHHEPEALLVVRVRHEAAVQTQVAVVAQGAGAAGDGRGRQRVQSDPGLPQQRPVVASRRQRRERLPGAQDLAGAVVEVEHAAGLDPAPVHHRVGGQRHLAGLGGDDQVVVGLHGAQRSQAEPVQPGADHVAVTEDEGGRAVVLLLVQGEELQHVADRGGQAVVVLPGRGHQRDHGLDDVETVVEDPALQGLVQPAAVGLTGRAHDPAQPGPGAGVVGQPVLAVGVQLAVVRHHPERLRHGRVRLGVGREPGVEVEGADLVAGVDQVGEVADDLARVQAALEHLGPRAQRERVEAGELGTLVAALLDLQQRGVGGPVDIGPGAVGGGDEHPLHDRQLVGHGGRAQGARVDRHQSFEQDLQALPFQGRADDPAGLRFVRGIGGHEQVGDTERAGFERPARESAEEADREIDAHPGAVADAFGRHATAVRDGAQGVLAADDDVVVLPAVLAGDEADAAGTGLAGGVVQADPEVIHVAAPAQAGTPGAGGPETKVNGATLRRSKHAGASPDRGWSPVLSETRCAHGKGRPTAGADLRSVILLTTSTG